MTDNTGNKKDAVIEKVVKTSVTNADDKININGEPSYTFSEIREIMLKGLEEDDKKKDKFLKQRYLDLVKTSFLIKVLNEIRDTKEDILKYYPSYIHKLGIRSMGNNDDSEIDICNHIAGVHSYNMLLFTREERLVFEDDPEYLKKLVDDIMNQIKTRLLGSILLKDDKTHERYKENFVFYPPIYYAFVQVNYLAELLNGLKIKKACKTEKNLYCVALMKSIIKRLMGIFNLIESDNFECAYSISRGAIELYLTLIVLQYTDIDYRVYDKFNNFKLDSDANGKLPEDFINEFNKKTGVDIIDYLNYGWLDGVMEYGYITNKSGNHSYKFHELTELVDLVYKKYYNVNGYGEYLRQYYNKCHIYTHGNIMTLKYPIIYIMDLCDILSRIVLGITNEAKRFISIPVYEGIDIEQMLKKHSENMNRLQSKVTTDKLVKYYNERK